MNIKHIEISAHAGGLTRLLAVVGGDRGIIAENVRQAKENPDKWELELRKVRKKRSLDANSYYWVLLEKLAQALRTTKDELHEIMLRDYGTFKRRADGGLAVFSLQAGHDPHDVTPYSRAFATGEVDGKEFIHYAVLKGSSEMNSEEFSVLLDGLIYECREQGIETLPPDEIARMKETLKNEIS